MSEFELSLVGFSCVSPLGYVNFFFCCFSLFVVLWGVVSVNCSMSIVSGAHPKDIGGCLLAGRLSNRLVYSA